LDDGHLATLLITSLFLNCPANPPTNPCSYLLPERAGKGKQKTAICRRTTSPRWEQTLVWEDLSLAEVADRGLEVAVFDHDRLGQHELLGGVRLNLGTGTVHCPPQTLGLQKFKHFKNWKNS
jgi:C2 domain